MIKNQYLNNLIHSACMSQRCELRYVKHQTGIVNTNSWYVYHISLWNTFLLVEMITLEWSYSGRPLVKLRKEGSLCWEKENVLLVCIYWKFLLKDFVCILSALTLWNIWIMVAVQWLFLPSTSIKVYTSEKGRHTRKNIV